LRPADGLATQRRRLPPRRGLLDWSLRHPAATAWRGGLPQLHPPAAAAATLIMSFPASAVPATSRPAAARDTVARRCGLAAPPEEALRGGKAVAAGRGYSSMHATVARRQGRRLATAVLGPARTMDRVCAVFVVLVARFVQSFNCGLQRRGQEATATAASSAACQLCDPPGNIRTDGFAQDDRESQRLLQPPGR